jgi:hypothetical protein
VALRARNVELFFGGDKKETVEDLVIRARKLEKNEHCHFVGFSKMKTIRSKLFLALTVLFEAIPGYGEKPYKISEKYREESISKIDPKIVVSVDGKTLSFVLSVNDSTAMVAQECYEWILDSTSAISKVVDLDHQDSYCETAAVNLNGQSASIDLVDKVSMLIDGREDGFYVKKVTSERDPVVLLNGIQYGSYHPYSYVRISSKAQKLKIEFRVKSDCLSYEFDEKTGECKGKHLPIQWGGNVRKEVELEISEKRIGIK